jgi:ribonuclease HII
VIAGGCQHILSWSFGIASGNMARGIAEPLLLEREIAGSVSGNIRIAGIDEAGRGPLAGPVVVAAVVLPLEPGAFTLPVNDSKQLSRRQREELAAAIRSDSRISYKVVMRSAAEIDRVNILRATQSAMREAAESLPGGVDLALIDGVAFQPFPVEARFLVHGDARSASIAAASILAKTAHDAVMLELDKQYPGYGFAENMGYGTAAHLEALNRLGPCPEHRRSFGPVSQPTLF